MTRPSVSARILLAAGVLALGLVGLVVREGMARARGQEVRLSIAGYDPRSPLSGHYVQFQLADRLPGEQVCRWADRRQEALPEGWLALRREGDIHRIVARRATRDEALKLGDAALRGRGACFGTRWVGPDGRTSETGQEAPLDIGVDRIHLAQDEAERAAKALQQAPGDAQVVLSVGGDGKARLRGLVVGGRRIDVDWF